MGSHRSVDWGADHDDNRDENHDGDHGDHRDDCGADREHLGDTDRADTDRADTVHGATVHGDSEYGDGADPGDGAGNREDHFGLFDDGGPATAAGQATGGIDLGELREVLAGRQERPAENADAPRAGGRRARKAARKRKRHRVRSSIVAILVMVLIAGGVTAGVVWWRNRTAVPTDYAGAGAGSVIVRVQAGDGLTDVAQTLFAQGVIASVGTFVTVAGDAGTLSALQPGYYRVREHASAKSTIAALADPSNRLGQLRIIPGQTLADLTKVSTTGETSTKPGILTDIAKACVPTSGSGACFSVDDLWHVAETESLSDLGVVGWATASVEAAPDAKRRLEGLIVPGDYDIAPGSTAAQALETVVQASSAQWNTTGIVAAAKSLHTTAYRLVTIASLVQAEGIGSDMPKVARVIDNRLHDGTKLEFDSTVNYGLNRAQISTTNAERLDPTNLYSTYAHAGLPPTPIGSPGPDALAAASDPAVGTWLYFVAIDKEGHTCFSTTDTEHAACVDEARANGVFG